MPSVPEPIDDRRSAKCPNQSRWGFKAQRQTTVNDDINIPSGGSNARPLDTRATDFLATKI